MRRVVVGKVFNLVFCVPASASFTSILVTCTGFTMLFYQINAKIQATTYKWPAFGLTLCQICEIQISSRLFLF